ncbi:MAG: oligosaccharide flippase family protein [bacterium]|nr:oligosaccharide flippase family protein [bacterium]
MTKSLSTKIGEGVFWLGTNSIIIKLVGLASVFLILRRLSVFEYGVSELVYSVVSLLSLFLLPGLADLILAEFGREKSQNNMGAMKKLFFDYATVSLGLGIILWAVLFFGADIISAYYSKTVAGLLRISSFLFFTMSFRPLVRLLQDANLKFFNASLFSFTEEFAKLGFLILFFFRFNLRIEGIFLSQIFSQVLTFLLFAPVFFTLYRNFSSAKPLADISLRQILFSHGKWAIFINYFSGLADNLRLWIIKFFLGTEAVGLFAVAYGLYGHTSALFPLNSVVKPIIPQYFTEKEKFYKLISKSVKYQALGYFVLSIVAFFLFPPMIGWIFPDYVASMHIFRGLIPSLVITGSAGILTSVFYAMRLQKRLVFNVVFKLVLSAVFLPVFISFFGVYGIALEFFLTAILVAWDRYAALKKALGDFRISLADFFTADDMDKYFIKKIRQFVFSKFSFLRFNR